MDCRLIGLFMFAFNNQCACVKEKTICLCSLKFPVVVYTIVYEPGKGDVCKYSFALKVHGAEYAGKWNVYSYCIQVFLSEQQWTIQRQYNMQDLSIN